MGTFNTSLDNTFGAKINASLADGYKSSAGPLEITVTFTPPMVPDDTLLNETNFYLDDSSSPTIPANIVNGQLQLKFLKGELDPTKYVGFRLSSDTANDDLTFKTATTGFATDAKSIVSNVGDPSAESFVWATVTSENLSDDGEGYVVISVDLNYVGTTAGTTSTFSVDVYETSNVAEDDSLVELGSVSETQIDGETVDLTITAYSSAITPVMTSHDPTALTTEKTSFTKNSAIGLKGIYTTTTTDGYKPVSKLVVSETITTNITAAKLYLSTNSTITSQSELDADSTTTVSVDLTSSLPTEVTYADGVIGITMQYADGSAPFDILFTGENNTLASTIYIYVIGTITGIGA